MKWYLQALKKYAVFRGRSRRREFWTFFLTNLITIHLLIFFIIATLLASPETAGDGGDGIYLLFGALVFFLAVYLLAILLPTLALYVRRLHDIGRSGRWFWLNLVPFGNLVLLVMCAQDSELGDNEYGMNPKGIYQPIVGYNAPASYPSSPTHDSYEQKGAPVPPQFGRSGRAYTNSQSSATYARQANRRGSQSSQLNSREYLGRHSENLASRHSSIKTNPLLRPENISDAPKEDFGNNTYRANDYKGQADVEDSLS